MDNTGLSQKIGADNIFSNDQEAFDQLYLRGVIDTRLGRSL